jgi:hypothetical protein
MSGVDAGRRHCSRCRARNMLNWHLDTLELDGLVALAEALKICGCQ